MKPGRNDLCACGSGRKYKKCCGPQAEHSSSAALSRCSLLLRQGRFAELEDAARQLITEQPDLGMGWKLLAVALHRQGKDAMNALAKAAALSPEDAESQRNLGNALRRQGQLAEAIASHSRALVINPGYAEAHNDLGAARLELGQTPEAVACFRQAIRLKADFALAHLNLGRALLSTGNAEQALASYQRAVDLQPASAAAHWNLGNVLVELGRTERAVTQYQRAVALQPDYAVAYSNLGCALRDLGRLDAAEVSLRRAQQLLPEQTEIHNNLGIVLRLLHRYDEAAASAVRAHELKPDFAPPLISLARIRADQGDFAAAEDMLRRALVIDPDSAEACSAIAGLRKMTPDDAEWFSEAERIGTLGLPARQQAHLHFAMGKYCDDCGDFAQAFGHFRRANDLKRSSCAAYDREGLHRSVTRIMECFGVERVNQWREAAAMSARPVFIVGMPRSGTSLAEQILASHPSIHGAGELVYWSQALTDWPFESPQGAEEDALLRSCAEKYLALIESQGAGAAHVVDKMPANFLCLGLIHAALPNARIIHMRRDPIDTCLSVYFQDFEAAYDYATDLEDLAHYHDEYSRIMQHWQAVLPPGAMMEVPYEALVTDFEIWSKKMIEFLGVAWDPICLEFHQTRRTVITASKWQVRQKISTGSVERWRNYERHLGPLLRLRRST
jgi:tetratricopeptide (TPR) repeat protein